MAHTRSKVEKVNMNFYIKLSIKTLDNVQFLKFLKKDKSNWVPGEQLVDSFYLAP